MNFKNYLEDASIYDALVIYIEEQFTKQVIRMVLDEDVDELAYFNKKLENGFHEDVYVLNKDTLLKELPRILIQYKTKQ